MGFESVHEELSHLSLTPIMRETPRLSSLRLRSVFPSSMSAMTLSNITRLSLIPLHVELPKKLEQMLMAIAGTLSALLLDVGHDHSPLSQSCGTGCDTFRYLRTALVHRTSWTWNLERHVLIPHLTSFCLRQCATRSFFHH